MDKFRALANNRELGSSALLAEFINLIQHAEKEEIYQGVLLLQNAFPVMAVWHFTEAFFEKHGVTPDAISEITHLVRHGKREVIRNALEPLKRYKRFLTFSRSSIVEATLIKLNEQVDRVICAESLPAREGVALTERLRGARISVHCVPDIELVNHVRDVDVLLLGADWLRHNEFVNKFGTKMLVEQACTSGIPVYVLAERFKMVDHTLPEAGAFYQTWIQGGKETPIPIFEIVPKREMVQYLTD